VVTLDGSALAEVALQPAARLVAALAAPGRGAIHLLRVLDHPPAASEQSVLPYRDPDEAALEAARTYLATVSQRFEEGDLASLRLRISSSVRAGLDAACAILDVAEAGDMAAPGTPGRPYDVIAMATHGRSGLALWALGSVTDRVLQSTSAPLLVVPPGEPGAEMPRQGDS
jgi:nucleotide-binding universal stress UspA family protein